MTPGNRLRGRFALDASGVEHPTLQSRIHVPVRLTENSRTLVIGPDRYEVPARELLPVDEADAVRPFLAEFVALQSFTASRMSRSDSRAYRKIDGHSRSRVSSMALASLSTILTHASCFE